MHSSASYAFLYINLGDKLLIFQGDGEINPRRPRHTIPCKVHLNDNFKKFGPISLNSVFEQLRQFRVIPVVRTSTPEIAATAIEWLSEAGLRTFEITMTILSGD